MRVLASCYLLTAACAIGPTTDHLPDPTSIVGGTAISIDAAPYQAAILRQGNQYCGGTILGAGWVLSAAHCAIAAGDQVGAGWHTLSELATNGQLRTIAEVYTGAFITNQYRQGNDIALLRLAEPLALDGTNARAADLPAPGVELPVGAVLTVSGWGRHATIGSKSNELYATQVSVVAAADVASGYGDVSADQLGAADVGRDACVGDSGGPLVAQTGGNATVVGIVSWGRGCATPGFPGMYTKLTAHLEWVTGIMNMDAQLPEPTPDASTSLKFAAQP